MPLVQLRCLFGLKTMDKALSDFIGHLLDADIDEKKLPALMGLIEEACDCKKEIIDLKEKIKDLTERGARFTVIARRERLLLQKRANYTNMIARICKELKKHEEKENPADYLDDLGDYE